MLRVRSRVARPLSLLGAGLMLSVLLPALARAQSADDLRRLSLEELIHLELTTVSRVPQAGLLTPAAVFVITAEDIRRSGVTTLAGALRLAPGVHVARIDSSKWAIGIRGFADRLARSMLVLVDGRAVYSTLFAGTYWEVQDLLLADIDRIEVIRGPGGTLWGANAVYGIVNIITRSSVATQGWYAEAGGGSEHNATAAVRYGGRRGDALHYRLYAMGTDRDGAFHASGANFDPWQMIRSGARVDWALGGDRSLTFSGEVYGGDVGQRSQLTTYNPPALTNLDDDARLSGAHVVARWHDPERRVQILFDRTNRTEPTFREFRNTLDVDFQQLAWRTARHQLLWGASARVSAGDIESVETQRFLPEDRTDALVTGFVQDEITLRPDRLRLTLGAKIERNGYSGVELQPSARLLWTPRTDQALYLAIARAVRTPSRVEQDFERTALLNPAAPLFLRLVPNDEFDSEKLVAYELGYRLRPAPSLFVTATAFFHEVDDILSTEPGATFVETEPPPAHQITPVIFANGLHGNTRGLEVTADLRPRPWLRWTGAYSLLRIELSRDFDSRDLSQEIRGERLSPRHQVQSHLAADLGRRWETDWLWRFVGELPGAVPSYAVSDIRIGFRVTPRIDLSLIGRNLPQAHHLEFPGGGIGNVEIQREVLLRLTWRR